MSSTSQEQVDIERAQVLWADYCRNHDIGPLHGLAAGIEPISGRIWFGESAADIYDKKVADGIVAPFFVMRVGSPTYLRKGRRQ